VARVGGQSQPRAIRAHNTVLPLLFAAGAAAVASTGFLTVAPNRLVSGSSIGLFAAAPAVISGTIAGLGCVLLGLSFCPPASRLHRAAAVIAAGLLLGVLAAAGKGAAAMAPTLPGLARVSLGAAFWVLLGIAGLAVIDGLQRAKAGPGEQAIFVAGLASGAAAMAYAGVFDALSLAHEFYAREAAFGAAVIRHAILVLAAIVPALLIGFPLGVAALRRPHWQGPVFAVLNLLQTIPSIALFGLLLVPLSALATAMPLLADFGIGGVGMAPAIIALILYALLPVVRNTVTGIGGVDAAVLDAARGIGMTQRQRFWQIELPLAAPLLLAGLRIVLVQTIGLAVVAALIGAGGLGTFVFAGLGQYATDLVLLGAVPAILLALLTNFLLQMLIAAVAR
jgi:osmoprotectant transport system permease protein